MKYAVLLIVVILPPYLSRNELGMGDPFFCKYLCPQGVLEARAAAGGGQFRHPRRARRTVYLESSRSADRYRVQRAVLPSVLQVAVPARRLYALLNRVSLFQMQVDTHKCVSCGACAKACKMDVDITKNPNHAECIRCGMCMKACPTGAICYRYGLGDKTQTTDKGETI